MATGKLASWALSEQFLDEERLFATPGVCERARERGSAIGLAPVLAGSAAHARSVVAMLGARAIVQVGAGAGALSLYLASAMGSDATLTAIDPEPENVRLVRKACAEAQIPEARVRTINAQPLDVFTRLTRGAYDMIVVNASEPRLGALVEGALDIIRLGGALVIMNVMHHDRLGDSSANDPETAHIREVVADLKERDNLVLALSPAGDGVLTAVKARL
ncbi:O-methyltransferase [Dermabacter hominis 1368]|uniref:O-methyltransferase n=1 Tax=Dermabacter hominis 1368 TaxID=1450519 RepID=A0ABR4SKW6_9MICO|nr:O-methyltransferase [Dermabacter hominis 1368]